MIPSHCSRCLKLFILLLIAFGVIGCTSGKRLWVEGNEGTFVEDLQFSEYCRSQDTIVVDDSLRVGISEDKTMKVSTPFSRYTGGMVGFYAGALSGMLLSRPVGYFACADESDASDGFGSERGWCKLGYTFSMSLIGMIPGMYLGYSRFSRREVNLEDVMYCNTIEE